MAFIPSFDKEFQTRRPTSSSLFLITDTSNYVAAGIALADASVSFVITGPDGIPLPASTIAPNVSLTNNLVSIPLGVDGSVQCGTYTFAFTTTIVGGVEPDIYTTSYAVQFCPTEILAVFDWQNNCFVTPLVSVANQTPYVGTPVSSTFTLYPPPNAPYNTPIVSAGLNVNSGSVDVYSGTWSVSLDSIYTITYPTYTWNYQVTHYATANGQVVSSSTQEVVCGQLCGVNCCMNEAFDRWWAARERNAPNETQLFLTYARADAVYARALRDLECGSDADIATRVEEIQEILSCSGGCGDCAATEGGLIVPRYTGSSLTYTFSSGSVSVSVTVLGTAVTIGLTAAAEQVIANVYNYALGLAPALTTAGFTYITATVAGNPDLISGTLGFTGEFPSVVQKYTQVFGINLTLGGVALTTVVGSETINGSDFVTPTITAVDGGVFDWPNQPALFDVAAFHAVAPAGGIKYKAILTQVNSDPRGAGSPYMIEPIKIEIEGESSNSAFRAVVRDAAGNSVTWGWINLRYRSIDFQLTIQG